MGKFRLTERAAADLQAILEFGIDRFGPQQARRYQDEFARLFELISDHPLMGRLVDVGTQMRRHEHGRHVVFYERDGIGILVVAIYDNRSIRQPPGSL